MERYNFKTVESKWQSFWSENNSLRLREIIAKKILLFRNVPLSIWKNSHGPC